MHMKDICKQHGRWPNLVTELLPHYGAYVPFLKSRPFFADLLSLLLSRTVVLELDFRPLLQTQSTWAHQIAKSSLSRLHIAVSWICLLVVREPLAFPSFSRIQETFAVLEECRHHLRLLHLRCHREGGNCDLPLQRPTWKQRPSRSHLSVDQPVRCLLQKSIA